MTSRCCRSRGSAADGRSRSCRKSCTILLCNIRTVGSVGSVGAVGSAGRVQGVQAGGLRIAGLFCFVGGVSPQAVRVIYCVAMSQAGRIELIKVVAARVVDL